MLLLAAPEAAYVAAYLGRLRTWDPRAAVRLQVRGQAVGLYSAPAPGVLALIAVPLAEPVAGTGPADEDRTVSAGRLRDVLGTVAGPRARELRLPDPVVGPAELAALPPRQGWQPGWTGVAADVPPDLADPSATDPSWGGVPARAWEVARRLGLLSRSEAVVRTSTAGAPERGWSRLATPGGQVFARSGSPDLLTRPDG